MSVLTSGTRNKLAPGTFGLPAQRKYPMPDANHAADAKARAKQQLNAGKLSAADYAHVRAMANRKLGEK